MQSVYAHVKLARISFKLSSKELSCQIQEEVYLKWCANLHLKILTLISECTKFIQSFKSAMFSSIQPVTQASEKLEKSLSWIVEVKGDINLHLILGSSHEMILISSGIMAGNVSNYVGGETALLKIIIDGAQIFTFEALNCCRVFDDKDVKEERRKTEGLVLDKNNIW